MDIKIEGFRNIKHADLTIEDNKYIVIYGKNGVGKSSFCKALECVTKNEVLDKHKSFFDDYPTTNVEISQNTKAFMFNELYIDSVMLVENRFIKNAYEIIVKTDEILYLENEIENHLHNIKTFINSNKFIALEKSLNSILKELPVKKDKTIGDSNKVSFIRESNILNSDNLGALTPLKKSVIDLTNWATWWSNGLNFYNSNVSICPFCAQSTIEIDDSIQKFKDVINGKNAKQRTVLFENFRQINNDIVLDLSTFESILLGNASPDSETNKKVDWQYFFEQILYRH